MNATTNTEKTALATRPEQSFQLSERAPALSGRDLILHADNFTAMLTLAKVMSQSKQAVPKHLRGNEGGCLAVTMQAMRWNMDPFALALKTYTTDSDGPIAYEGQAIIAALNNSPLLATRLDFRWEGAWEKIIGKFEWRESKKKQDEHGEAKRYLAPTWADKDEDGLKVIVSARLQGESEPRVLELYLKQARVRNSPLWTEDPRQQLAYLGGRRWGRIYAPDVIMGVYTPDELEERETRDMGPADVVSVVPPELMERAKTAAAGGVASYQTFWKGCTNTERALLCEKSDEHENFKRTAVEADEKRTVDNGPGRPTATPGPTPGPTPAASAAPTTAATPAAAQSDPALPVDGKVTEEGVRAMLEKAGNADAVDIAGDWINEVPDQAARGRLQALYEQCRAKFEPK
jgi:hypothetical protein